MPMPGVRDLLTTPISTTTACLRAHDLGFNNRIAAQKPFLSDNHKAARLRFAEEHPHWDVNDWRKVLWTDESSFEIGKNSKQIHVWKKPQTKYKKQNLAPTFKSGRMSTMVWGSFFSNTKGPLKIFPPGQRKAADFIENIYKPSLIPFLNQVNPNQHLILMEDNAPVHTARISRKFLKSKGIKKISWPAQSPDLNPIENVWLILKRNIQDFYQPKNVPEMPQAIQQAWEDLPTSILDHLIESMPRRMQEVIKESGGSTHW
jgi:transposase